MNRLARRRVASFVPAIATLLLLLLGSTAWMMMDGRRTAEREAGASAGAVALGLERSLAREVEILDMSLQGAQRALGLPGLAEMAPDIQHQALFDGALSARGY
ncbi:MAG TPA: hypothetical protein VGC80_14190, partial [Acetobacteraceae bacterium]